MSSSNVDFSFLFSTNTICTKVQHSKHAPRTSQHIWHASSYKNCECHLLFGIAVNERVDNFPHFHKHVRCMDHNTLPHSFWVVILHPENGHNEVLHTHKLMHNKIHGPFQNYTCKMVSALRYPRMSLFLYPHPLISAMAQNFSCPGGILIHQSGMSQSSQSYSWIHSYKCRFCIIFSFVSAHGGMRWYRKRGLPWTQFIKNKDYKPCIRKKTYLRDFLVSCNNCTNNMRDKLL